MSLSAPRGAPAAAARPAPPPRSAAERRATRTVADPVAPALPPGRAGFVLYVSLPEDGSPADGRPGSTLTAADLAGVAELLRESALDLLPAAETYTALSLAPQRPGPSVEFGRFGERLSHLRLLAPLPDDAPTAGASAPDVLGESGDTR
ncbi:hypothetical protein ACTHAM_000975 [Cellulomonas soli]|uniref:hypothetical protein n=1 Tax=Cellulomonas soli TaxID=931535 RepID=UPI003F8298BF